jgi:hypothetical protein
MCYLETSVMRWPRHELGCCTTEEIICYKVLRYLRLCRNIRMSRILYSIVVTAAVSKGCSKASCGALRLWHFPCFVG